MVIMKKHMMICIMIYKNNENYKIIKKFYSNSAESLGINIRENVETLFAKLFAKLLYIILPDTAVAIDYNKANFPHKYCCAPRMHGIYQHDDIFYFEITESCVCDEINKENIFINKNDIIYIMGRKFYWFYEHTKRKNMQI